MPEGAPSVEIQRLPSASQARLSGQEIGETCSTGKPEKYGWPPCAGTPQTRSRCHANVVEVWSPCASISPTWPTHLSWLGLTTSGGAPSSTPRSELFVQATYTRRECDEGSTSSQRSIFVGPTASAARRVCTRTSSTPKPGTWDSPSTTSGSHSPVPSKAPSEGSSPEPSISSAGELPEKRATKR